MANRIDQTDLEAEIGLLQEQTLSGPIEIGLRGDGHLL
jgi:hypothetical protein